MSSLADPCTVHERITRGDPVLCLDVRMPFEYRALHAAGAQSMPLPALDAEAVRRLAGGTPIYLFCQSGARAEQAAQQLEAAGVTNCSVVVGGTQAWADAGLPVVRGRQTLPLERQVRIGAGILVLLGIGLGLGVHPGCFGIAAFVGAGLVFSGVTGFCGMALLLARMPWNRCEAVQEKSRS